MIETSDFRCYSVLMSKLYVVATPIGNLEDITLRAIRILKECDFVICEDTRVTGKLLKHLQIDKKMISMNAYSEKKNLNALVEKIKSLDYARDENKVSEGKVALVSDAGTPAISDPGTRLVSLARENEIEVEPIPGPSALTSALSASGFDTSTFKFLGFLPKKKGRQTLFDQIPEMKETLIFYESPHRILKTLEELTSRISDRKVGIYKEISKIHEEFIAGNASETRDFLSQNEDKVKGEFVVIIDAS
jgi:16S rRNA (cytidine1402-2'-O)-methyltransferase